jgi:hypothetical protein
MTTLKLILRAVPWVVVLVLVIYVLLIQQKINGNTNRNVTSQSDVILQKTESLGKLELTKYYFKEITEIRIEGRQYNLIGIPLGKLEDKKALLISTGEAVGCIDLSKLNPDKINTRGDTIYIELPAAELCNVKLDLQKTRLYDFDLDLPKADQAATIDSLYRMAEDNIRKSALQSEILQETERNGKLLLAPLLKEITGKPVILSFPMMSDGQLEPM